MLCYSVCMESTEDTKNGAPEIQYQKKTPRKRGKTFNKRKTVGNGEDGTLATANQWQATERQLLWLRYYVDINEKETVGNAYQAAIKAGFSEAHAANIASKNAPEWVNAGKAVMRTMNVEHIRGYLEDVLMNRSGFEQTKDRIAVAKLLGIDQGMFIEKKLVAHTGIEDAIRDLE